MVIDGTLVKKNKNTVYVKQHYTGTVYKTDVSNVAEFLDTVPKDFLVRED